MAGVGELMVGWLLCMNDNGDDTILQDGYAMSSEIISRWRSGHMTLVYSLGYSPSSSPSLPYTILLLASLLLSSPHPPSPPLLPHSI
jgi:hypothetical protein